MTTLLLFALIAAFAANVALVPFVAGRLSSKNSAPVPAGGLLASNENIENIQAVAKIAA